MGKLKLLITAILFLLTLTAFGQISSESNKTPEDDQAFKRGQEIIDKAMKKWASDNEFLQKNFSYIEKRINVDYEFKSSKDKKNEDGKEKKREEKTYLMQSIKGVLSQKVLDGIKKDFEPAEGEKLKDEEARITVSLVKAFRFKFVTLADAKRPFYLLAFYPNDSFVPGDYLEEAMVSICGTAEVWADNNSLKAIHGYLCKDLSYGILADVLEVEFDFYSHQLDGGLDVLGGYRAKFKIDGPLVWNYNQARIRERSSFKKLNTSIVRSTQ